MEDKVSAAEAAFIESGAHPAQFARAVRAVRRAVWPLVRPFHFHTMRQLADLRAETSLRLDRIEREVDRLATAPSRQSRVEQGPRADTEHLSDEVWRRLSQTIPYWAVLSMPDFEGEITPEARAKFFRLGDEYVDHVFARLASLYPGRQTPAVAIDFGCGLGRLTRALAARCERVYAVDVAPDMLDQCVSNCAEAGWRNVTPVLSDDRLTGLAGVEADIILTSITFQHIRPSRGLAIMEALLARLSVGGAAWLHVLVAGASNQVAGVSDKDQVLREARQLIEMNVYPADQLLLLLARFSPELHLAFSPAGGQLGADIMLVRRG